MMRSLLAFVLNVLHPFKRLLRGLAYYFPNAHIRRLCFRLTSVKMGDDVYPRLGIIVMDDYCNGEVLLEIGNSVALSPGIIFIANSAPRPTSRLRNIPYVRDNLIKRAKIVVEDDAWIGAGAVILPGVRIGQGAIVGAGAVVTRDVPPFTIVAGAPARVIRTLVEQDPDVHPGTRSACVRDFRVESAPERHHLGSVE
jgi:acetyltransferase-like isoleucine patch superfamily enzyme